jgi:glyoxylase-like metal-dependent hydrolase (beta-lactamase superfamily II)
MAIAAGAQSFDIVPMADGVYAAIGRRGVFSNGAFIVNQDDVLVVDTHLRPSWARDLIQEIRKVTNKPVRYVVNTHWHGDHVQGNQAYVNVFGPNVEYLAQHMTREDMVRKAIPSIQQSLTRDVPERIAQFERMLAEGKNARGEALTDQDRANMERTLANDKAYLEELRQMQLTLPTITFERSLVLHKPDREIHILYFGRGHTRGDVVVYLPKEKVVVTGDLLTNGIPFARDSYPSHWVATLEALERLDWQKAAPGHGGVQEGKTQIRALIAYMKDMVEQVRQAVGKGLSQQETRRTVDLRKHLPNFAVYANAPQGFDQASGNAVDRAWLELSGKIPD